MIVAVLVYLCGVCPVSAQEWRVQNSGTSANLNKICFVDSIHGWAVGENSTIVHTTNGGNLWLRQHATDTIAVYKSIFCVDDSNCVIVGNSNAIVGTTDGGNTWIKRNIPSTKAQFLNDVYFSNARTGWIVADGNGVEGSILKSTDGGGTWNVVYDSSNGGGFRSVHFIDNKQGWSSGFAGMDLFDPGVVIHTSDGGATWKFQQIDHRGSLKGVYFISPVLGWAVGGGPWRAPANALKTTDGGLSWNYSGPPIRMNSRDEWFPTVACIDSLVVLLGSQAGCIHRSENGGGVWVVDTVELPNYIASVFCLDVFHCWACGDSGRIWKYTPSILSVHEGTSSLPDDPVVSIAVSQRRHVIDIAYTLNRPISIATDLYDLLGKKLVSRNLFFQGEGSRTCSFDVHDYSGGVYYILSTIGSRTYVNSVSLSR